MKKFSLAFIVSVIIIAIVTVGTFVFVKQQHLNYSEIEYLRLAGEQVWENGANVLKDSDLEVAVVGNKVTVHQSSKNQGLVLTVLNDGKYSVELEEDQMTSIVIVVVIAITTVIVLPVALCSIGKPKQKKKRENPSQLAPDDKFEA